MNVTSKLEAIASRLFLLLLDWRLLLCKPEEMNVTCSAELLQAQSCWCQDVRSLEPRQTGPEECLADRTKQLGTKGIATRSKKATRGSWPYY